MSNYETPDYTDFFFISDINSERNKQNIKILMLIKREVLYRNTLISKVSKNMDT